MRAIHGQVFENVTETSGVDYRQWEIDEGETLSQPFMTGGAAAGDYDGDGWVDLYVTRLDAPDILFRNRRDGTFEDVAKRAGLARNLPTNGAAWGDIDKDGDLDLYVSVTGDTRYYLYINDGSGGFREEAVERGAGLEGGQNHYGYSVAFGDYDRDGWLDIHTTEWGVAVKESEPRMRGVLLRNRGLEAPGFFDNVTSETGLEASEGATLYSFTSSFSDFDRDGWPDLAIAGDFGTSRLFWNNGDGTFTEGTHAAGVGADQNGMGSAIGDYNGDGFLDWFVTSIFDAGPDSDRTGNRLYHNNGDRTFSDATDAAGVRDGGWGWGSAFFDYDNDGDLDLVMTNGMRFPGGEETTLHTPMRLWRNEGGVFREVGAEAGVTDNGQGKGLLTFDYDRDGDLDLFVVNNGGHPVLYRNDGGNRNHWLRVRTIGRVSNRDGIGAFITVEPELGGPAQVREITPGNHFLGQSEPTAHFGLGKRTQPVARLTVEWPSGADQIFEGVAVNTELIAEEPALSVFLAAGAAVIVNEGTFFLGNIYNGFELAEKEATFSSRFGEITRISFLDPDGDLVFAEFGSDDPRTTLTIRLSGSVAAAPSPYNQPGKSYMRGLASFTIENPTALTFFSVFSLGNDPERVDNGLILEDTFSGKADGMADIKMIAVKGNEEGTAEIGGINAANANFTDSAGIIGIAAEAVRVRRFLYLGDLTPSGSASPWIRISPSSTLPEVQINGGDLGEATGPLQIDTNNAVYAFPIVARDGRRSIAKSPFRPDLGDGALDPAVDTFARNSDAYFLTDGQN